MCRAQKVEDDVRDGIALDLRRGPVPDLPPHPDRVPASCLSFEGRVFSKMDGAELLHVVDRRGRGLWFDRWEVTWRQWESQVRRHPELVTAWRPRRDANAESEDHPVSRLLASQARRYAELVGRRLPTRQEWLDAAGARRGQSMPDAIESLRRCSPTLRPDGWNPSSWALDIHAVGTKDWDLTPSGLSGLYCGVLELLDEEGSGSPASLGSVPVAGWFCGERAGAQDEENRRIEEGPRVVVGGTPDAISWPVRGAPRGVNAGVGFRCVMDP
jgi:formylglycine-generating enzyme required for sulfatase activity